MSSRAPRLDGTDLLRTAGMVAFFLLVAMTAAGVAVAATPEKKPRLPLP